MSYVADRRNIQFMFIFVIFTNLNFITWKIAKSCSTHEFIQSVRKGSTWFQLQFSYRHWSKSKRNLNRKEKRTEEVITDRAKAISDAFQAQTLIKFVLEYIVIYFVSPNIFRYSLCLAARNCDNTTLRKY